MRVVLIATVTVDGFIGKTSDHLADWSSKEDKRYFVKLTKELGTMVMGSNTFSTIGRALPGRRMIVLTSKPGKITAEGVETVSEDIEAVVERLKSEGASGLAVCGGTSVYGQFMKKGLVDEIHLSIEPHAFGCGLNLFSEEIDAKLKLISTEKLNDNAILNKYRVVKDS